MSDTAFGAGRCVGFLLLSASLAVLLIQRTIDVDQLSGSREADRACDASFEGVGFFL
jgi:hypothetical protein